MLEEFFAWCSELKRANGGLVLVAHNAMQWCKAEQLEVLYIIFVLGLWGQLPQQLVYMDKLTRLMNFLKSHEQKKD